MVRSVKTAAPCWFPCSWSLEVSTQPNQKEDEIYMNLLASSKMLHTSDEGACQRKSIVLQALKYSSVLKGHRWRNTSASSSSSRAVPISGLQITDLTWEKNQFVSLYRYKSRIRSSAKPLLDKLAPLCGHRVSYDH